MVWTITEILGTLAVVGLIVGLSSAVFGAISRRINNENIVEGSEQ